MKQYVIYLLLILFSATAIGQNKSSDDLNRGETNLPRFVGYESVVNGELKQESINNYLKIVLEYPLESVLCFEQGTEVVEFVVTAAGKPTDFKVVNSVCPKMDEEVNRAIMATQGKWIPGTVDGKAVDMKQEVSVVFAISSYVEYVKKAQNFARKGNKMLFEFDNPKKALKYFNYAVKLLPHDESLIAVRSLCRYATGDLSGAESDWERLKVLAQRNRDMNGIVKIAAKTSRLNGYEEMIMAINWNYQEMPCKH